jgi:hypothetical protein
MMLETQHNETVNFPAISLQGRFSGKRNSLLANLAYRIEPVDMTVLSAAGVVTFGRRTMKFPCLQGK